MTIQGATGSMDRLQQHLGPCKLRISSEVGKGLVYCLSWKADGQRQEIVITVTPKQIDEGKTMSDVMAELELLAIVNDRAAGPCGERS
jgi:hypothetical protein